MQETDYKKPEWGPAEAGWVRYVRPVAGLLAYFLIYYFVFRDKPAWILFITGIVLLHESGHFIAMKYFGYTDVKIFFIPLLGGFVSGAPRKISQWQRVVTLFAGPAPGILLGTGMLLLYQQTGDRLYYQLSFFLMALNAFNLLPVSPLDGGQLLDNLYGKKTSILQPFLLGITGVFVFWMAVKTGSLWLLALVWLIVYGCRRMITVMRIRRTLDKKGVRYTTSYEGLTDAAYMAIRRELIAHVPAFRSLDPEKITEGEYRMAKWVRRILEAPVEKDMSRWRIVLATLVWIALLVLPLVFIVRTFSLRLFLI